MFLTPNRINANRDENLFAPKKATRNAVHHNISPIRRSLLTSFENAETETVMRTPERHHTLESTQVPFAPKKATRNIEFAVDASICRTLF
jgi:hypothetical protein